MKSPPWIDLFIEMLGDKKELELSDGVISLLLVWEDFELDGLLLDDAYVPTVVVSILPVEFASQDQLS